MGLGTLPIFAALPCLMGFGKRRESLFFYLQVLAALGIIGMTDFNGSQSRPPSPLSGGPV
jgi:hypothetical protein